MTILRGRRGLLFALTTAMALLVACGPGEMCESDRDQSLREQAAKARATTPTPTGTPTSTVAAATSTPAASATAALFGGSIGLGFDHPPLATGNAGLGGNSAGIVCGVLTNVPAGSIITITLTGGTGAPPSVNGPVAAGGAFTLPFPITSFGPMNAAVGGIRTAAGGTLAGTVPPVSLPVAAGADVPCTPR